MCEQIARDYCKRAHSTAQCCIESAEAKGTGREQGVSSRYDCRISCSQSLFLATSFQQLLPSLLKRSTSRGNFWLASKKLDAQFCNVNKLHTQRAHKHAQTKSRHREKASIIDLVFWPKLFCLAPSSHSRNHASHTAVASNDLQASMLRWERCQNHAQLL